MGQACQADHAFSRLGEEGGGRVKSNGIQLQTFTLFEKADTYHYSDFQFMRLNYRINEDQPYGQSRK